MSLRNGKALCGPPRRSSQVNHCYTELCINHPLTFIVASIHMCPKLYLALLIFQIEENMYLLSKYVRKILFLERINGSVYEKHDRAGSSHLK